MLDELVAKLGIEIDKEKLRESQKGLDSISKYLTYVREAAAGLGVVLAELFANRQAANASQFQVMAQTLGLTTDQMRALELASKNAQVPLSQITGIIGDLQAQQAGWLTGNAPTELITKLAKASTILGVKLSALDPNGKPKQAYELFKEMATAIGNIHDKNKQLSASMLLFGQNILPLIGHGMKGINDAYAQLKGRNLLLPDSDYEKLHKFNEQMNLMGEAWTTIKQKSAVALAPVLTQLNSVLTNKENMQNFINLLTALAQAATILAQALAVLLPPLTKLIGLLAKLGTFSLGGLSDLNSLRQFMNSQSPSSFFSAISGHGQFYDDLKNNGVQLLPQAQARLNRLQAQGVLPQYGNTSTTNNASTVNNNSASNTTNNHIHISHRGNSLGAMQFYGGAQ